MDSSSSSGDERKESSSDDTETSQDDTSKKEEVSLILVQYILVCTFMQIKLYVCMLKVSFERHFVELKGQCLYLFCYEYFPKY